MQPDWAKVLGELIADHELADRKRVDEMMARIAALEARPIDKGATGEPGPQGLPGEKGEPGRDGRDASDLALLRDLIEGQVAAGIYEVVRMAAVSSPDGGRTLHVKLGDAVHKVGTAIPIDAGAWKMGTEYAAGDGVSHDGSFWIAQAKTNDRPPSAAWRLAVKRGRDGYLTESRDFVEVKRTPVRFK